MNGKPVLLCSALLAVVLLCFYFPWLTGQSSFYQSDLTYYFEPFTRFICDAYRAGRLPLWNPYLYCGMAQAAVPSPGPFYPFIACFLLGSFSQGVALYLIVHQLVAGLGAYLLVAALGWGIWPAALAAVGVALCGYMFALQDNYTLVATIAWLPLLLCALHKANGRVVCANIAFLLLASVCTAAMIGAGRPELFVPALLVAALWIFVVAVNERRWSDLIARVLSLVLGVGMALPVILPAMEWARLSPRAHGLELRWVLMWSANWYDCLGLICANPLGDLTHLGTKFLNMVASRKDSIPYLTSTYVGPILFTLAIWGLFDRRWSGRWLVLFVGVGAGFMAVGNNTPVAPLICGLSPAFAAFRYPVKLMIFPILAIIFLAAYGARCAQEKSVIRSAQISTAILWLLVLVIGLSFLALPGLSDLTTRLSWNAGVHIDMQLMHKAQALFGRSLLVSGALGVLTNVLYMLYVKHNWSSRMFTAAITAAVAVNLVWPACVYLRHATVADFYDRPSSLAQVLRKTIAADSKAAMPGSSVQFAHRVLTLYFDPLTPGEKFIENQHLTFQDGFYLYARSLLLPNNNVDHRLPYAFGYEAAEMGLYKQLFTYVLSKSSQNRAHDPNLSLSDAPLARFCKMTATSWVATQHYRHSKDNLVPWLDSQYFELAKLDEKLNVRLFKVKDTRLRAYFAQSATKVNWHDFLMRILDDGVRDMQSDTMVEEKLPGEIKPAEAKVVVSTDEPERVIITTSRPEAGLLVLTDQSYPGWTATIDDQPAKQYRTDFFGRGIWVPAGGHTIEFVYKPASVFAGLAAMMASFLLFILALVWAGLRPRS